MPEPPFAGDSAPARQNFPTTHWSMIRRAGAGEDAEADRALAHLCKAYWYPLYAYVRRWGHSVHDAQDLTQSFLLEMIDGPLLTRADPARGRFRSFVLGAIKNFLSKDHRHRQAERRGGRAQFVSIDEERDEKRYACEPVEHTTPEDFFERNWAFALLDAVIVRLRDEYEAAGRRELFDTVQPYLAGKGGADSYAALGRRLQLSENTIAVSIHRMRRRYGEILREEIALTVSSPGEVEAELTHLIGIMAR